MLELGHQIERTCGGISRRSLLQVGGLSFFGLGLPRLLQAEADKPAAARKDVNCILLWMGGGPSNIDTFDMKPNAPVEYRGDFKPIATNLPGVTVCEHLPKMARMMDKICQIRSTAHTESGDHTAATHYVLTGYPQRPDPAGQPAGSLVYPSFGSVVNRELGWRNSLPPYVLIGQEWTPFALSGYIGSGFDPLIIKGDPNDPKFSVQDVSIAESIGDQRTQRRRSMLAELDRWQKRVDRNSGLLLDRNRFYQQAYDLITSPAAKKAFNLDEEPAAVRDRYGRHIYGQSCLLARRLIEAGVRFVKISTNPWDTHLDNFTGLKQPIRLPNLDQYWSALLEDLEQRGMFENTVVIWMGEFGRTPQVNGQAGRDHWAPTNLICMSGAGVKMGTVVGATDAKCERVVGTPHSSHDLAATVYRLLGIDCTKEYLTPDGRPVLVNYHGQPIAAALT